MSERKKPLTIDEFRSRMIDERPSAKTTSPGKRRSVPKPAAPLLPGLDLGAIRRPRDRG
jgi:hypothetical protein